MAINKIASKLLVVVLVIVLFAMAFLLKPLSAQAASATDIATQINAIPGLTSTVTGSTVTVTGTANRTTNLALDIDAGVTVNWQAALTGNATANNYLLTLSGRGTFTVNGGGSVNCNSGAGGTVYISGGVTLNVTNGRIDSPGSGSAVTIAAGVAGAEINVNGGTISSTPSGYAINDGSGMTASNNNTQIRISAGLVESGSACAIRSTGESSVVTVSGGEVRNNASSNTNSTIYMNYAPAPNNNLDNIVVSGGLVRTLNPGNQSYVLQTSQNVRISGGNVESLSGRTINLVGMNSTATVTGGRVFSESGTAISTATTTLDDVVYAKIVISGGVVEARGTGTAVRITGAGSTAYISGTSTKVLAASGLAIDASGRPINGSVTVSGGLVFAWGNALNSVISPSAKLAPAMGGVIAAWNTTTGTGEGPYIQDSNDDLFMMPSGSVKWDNDPPSANNGGIRYGSSNEFHKLDVAVIQNTRVLTLINAKKIDIYDGSVLLFSRELTGADSAMYSCLVRVGHRVEFEARPDYVPGFTVPGPGSEESPPGPLAQGSMFKEWTVTPSVSFGSSNDDKVNSLTMPSNSITVTAIYDPLHYLRVYNAYINDVDGQGNNYPYSKFNSSPYGYFKEGATLTMTALSSYFGPGGSITFSTWNYGDVSLLTTPVAQRENAIFQMPGMSSAIGQQPSGSYTPPSTYTTTVEYGTITTTSAGSNVGAGLYTGFNGTGLYISANIPAGYRFDHWEVRPTSGGVLPDPSWVSRWFTFSSLTDADINFITQNMNLTLTAFFRDDYTLTVIGGSGTGTYAHDATVAITANPTPRGMVFSGWTIDIGGGEISNSSLTNANFTMASNDATVSVHYEWQPYNLTVENGIDILGTGLYHFDERIAVEANPPPPGMVFTGWTIVSGSGSFVSSVADNTEFIMPASDAVIRADYDTITSNSVPKTGVASLVNFWLMLLAVSATGVMLLILKARPSSRRNNL